MQMSFPVEQTIKARRSVRTYQDRQLSAELIDKIQTYIKGLSNPFGADVTIGMVHKSFDGQTAKLGTYGVIKGASTFLGLSVAPGEFALLGAGYEFEDLILYITSLGLGTVWLGATFSRDKFKSALGVPDNYLFPAISPAGYPAEKRLLERIMRKASGADNRKTWTELFFNGDFNTPLTLESAGEYGEALEMLRLAPSAYNAQPWRVLKDGDRFHFYVMYKTGAKDDDVKLKQVDMGIAMFHFDITLKSKGINGVFVDNQPQGIATDNTYHYVMTYQ